MVDDDLEIALFESTFRPCYGSPLVRATTWFRSCAALTERANGLRLECEFYVGRGYPVAKAVAIHSDTFGFVSLEIFCRVRVLTWRYETPAPPHTPLFEVRASREGVHKAARRGLAYLDAKGIAPELTPTRKTPVAKAMTLSLFES